MLCTIHNIEGKQFEKDGKVWYSHRTDDPSYPKGWCNLKLVQAPYSQSPRPQAQTTQIKEFNGRSNEFWDKRGRQIAMSGFTNAMLSAGVKPNEINVAELSVLLSKLESKAEEMTLDQNGPF